MLFTDLRTEILDRLNYTSTDSTTRVGRLINKVYREIGTAIGLSFSRQTNTSITVTTGTADQTFTATEKVLQVWTLDSDSNPSILSEVLPPELREEAAPSSDEPHRYAIISTTSNTVKIRLDAKPATAYTLYADIIGEVADLSGSNEPAFPESFHDIIIEGVLKDEYRKLEKLQLARESERQFEKRLSDLRMFMAKSNYLDIQQGKNSVKEDIRASGGGGASFGSTALTITGLWTFTRGSAVAPFAVSNTDATYVLNLGAEFLGNITTDRLIGRDTTGTGETEQLTVGGGVEFTGSGGIQRSALTGDVTASAGSNTTAIAAGVIVTADISDDQVTYAKMQNISATDRLLGRDTAAAGDTEELTVGGGIEFTGTGGIQTSALTGDVTKTAGGTATTIANDVVTYAKMQDVAANSFLARAAASSGDMSAVALAASQLAGRGATGDVAAIVLGSGLSMSGTTLSASGTDTDTQLSDIKVYTANDTWTKPAGLYAVVVWVFGGGGGGGGVALVGVGEAAAGNGGSSGGGSMKRVVAASLGATETVTVGAAGAGGTAGNNAGSAGGTSSFGAHASATGGAGGAGSAASAVIPSYNQGTIGAVGVGSSGNLNFAGNPGSRGIELSAGRAIGAVGGGSFFGGGAPETTDDAAGVAAQNYGAGGGGASRTSNGTPGLAGGAGTAGIVIVYEYVTA